MAIHTHLPIYKVAYDLLDVVTDLVKNMQRDFKRSIGEKITTECIEIPTAKRRPLVGVRLSARLGLVADAQGLPNHHKASRQAGR